MELLFTNKTTRLEYQRTLEVLWEATFQKSKYPTSVKIACPCGKECDVYSIDPLTIKASYVEDNIFGLFYATIQEIAYCRRCRHYLCLTPLGSFTYFFYLVPFTYEDYQDT